MQAEELLNGAIDGITLDVEPGTQLVLEIAGVNVRLNSVFLGVEQQFYLIVKTPREEIIKSKLYEGNDVIVRYLNAGTVYKFECEVIGHIEIPVRLLFLSYPRIIASKDLRKHKRVECRVPATVKIAEEIYRGAIIDVSKSGCRFSFAKETAENLPRVSVDQEISLGFQLLGETDTKKIGTRIKSIEQGTSTMCLGLAFDNSDEEVLKKIETYLEAVS